MKNCLGALQIIIVWISWRDQIKALAKSLGNSEDQYLESWQKRLQHWLCHGLFVSTLCFFSKSSRICFKVSCFSTKLSCNSPGQVNHECFSNHRCSITHLHSTLLLFVIGNILVNLPSHQSHFKKKGHEQSECANLLLPWFWPCSMERCADPVRLAVRPAQRAHQKEKTPITVRQKTYHNPRANPVNSQSHSHGISIPKLFQSKVKKSGQSDWLSNSNMEFVSKLKNVFPRASISVKRPAETTTTRSK